MTNINTDICIGAWISPTGDIYWTNNTQSHLAAIKKIGIDLYLKQIRDTLDWTPLESSMNRYNDLPYIAFKIGYIRISSYTNQIGIQYGKNVLNIQQLKSIKTILNQIITNSHQLSFTYVIECFEQSFKMLDNLNDVINELYNMINQI